MCTHTQLFVNVTSLNDVFIYIYISLNKFSMNQRVCVCVCVCEYPHTHTHTEIIYVQVCSRDICVYTHFHLYWFNPLIIQNIQ